MVITKRNETVVKYLPWIKARSLKIFKQYDSPFCEHEDVLQEGCVLAINSIDEGKHKPFSYWYVENRMRNFVRDYLKRKDSNNVPYDVRDIIPNSNKSENLDLKNAINSLDKNYREIILLFYYGGMDDMEISELMKKPKRTICYQRNKALRRLHEILH